MSKKNKPNFFSKFFKKKSDNELDQELDAEMQAKSTGEFDVSDMDIGDYGERYHSDYESKDGIQLDDPEEIFDATEFPANPETSNKELDNLPDFSNPEEIFPVSNTPPLIVDEKGDVISKLPTDNDLAEPTKSQFQHSQASDLSEDIFEGHVENDNDSTEAISDDAELHAERQLDQFKIDDKHTAAISQSIDINKIKNYELTSEDEHIDETFADYKLLTKKEDKGIKEFLDKGKNELEKFIRGDYKNLLKNVKRPKHLKSVKFWKSFNTKKVFNSLYSPTSRQNIHKIFLASAVIGGTYSTGKVTALIVKGTPSTKLRTMTLERPSNIRSNITADINSFKNNNIFNALLSETEIKVAINNTKEINVNVLCLKAEKASSLPLKLQHTLVLQDSVKSIASVQVRSNKIPQNVRRGENLDNIAKIGYVGRQKLIFKNLKTGECEFIEKKANKSLISTKGLTIITPNAGKVLLDNLSNKDIKNQGNTYKIKKSVREDMLANISEVLTQARAIQIKNPDGTYSFKMTEIVPGSIYSKLGIENGDIISEIDGKKISNLNEIMSKFGTIKDKDHFSLGIKKNGNVETKEYDFE
ncbi:MAG: hypothetical protein HN576_08740 [Bacteriovoracaceae bacterium]|jgi:hypothetical protein|nr:hypothetical protein [Bacteriovoracaceae bacterium]